MRKHIIGIVILFLILAYGCAQQDVVETQPKPIKEEAKIEVTPTIDIISVPATAEEGSNIAVKWKIESESTLAAAHTAVHYDKISHAGVLTTDDGPEAAGYASLTTEYASGDFSVPNEFSTQFKAPIGAEKIYLRAHAVISGKNYWTDEAVVIIEKAVKEEQKAAPAAPKEFVIEGDDNGLYPDSISAKKGDKVKITFQVRTKGVYYGGLDFRSDVWGTTGKISKGESASVEFTADKSFTFKSYWPASNRLKATGEVVVG